MGIWHPEWLWAWPQKPQKNVVSRGLFDGKSSIKTIRTQVAASLLGANLETKTQQTRLKLETLNFFKTVQFFSLIDKH